MIEWIVFILGSTFIIWYSLPSLRQPGSHGFYRFFVWEIILGLFVLNVRLWFAQPFAWYQFISWFLLVISIIPWLLGSAYSIQRENRREISRQLHSWSPGVSIASSAIRCMHHCFI